MKGQRVFERVLVTVSWRWARFAEQRLGTRNLQPQLRWVVFTGLVAGLLPLYLSGFEVAPFVWKGADPAFAALWVLGIGLRSERPILRSITVWLPWSCWVGLG